MATVSATLCQHLRSRHPAAVPIPDAARAGAPGSEAFRPHCATPLEAQKRSLAQGIFNITPANHNGSGTSAPSDLITIKDGKFRLLGESKVVFSWRTAQGNDHRCKADSVSLDE